MTSSIVQTDPTAPLNFQQMTKPKPADEAVSRLSRQILRHKTGEQQVARCTIDGKEWTVEFCPDWILFHGEAAKLPFEQIRSLLHIMNVTRGTPPIFVNLRHTRLTMKGCVQLMHLMPDVKFWIIPRPQHEEVVSNQDFPNPENATVMILKDYAFITNIPELLEVKDGGCPFREAVANPGEFSPTSAPLDAWIDALCTIQDGEYYYDGQGVPFQTARLLDALGFEWDAQAYDADIAKQLTEKTEEFSIEDLLSMHRLTLHWEKRETQSALKETIREEFTRRLQLDDHLLSGFAGAVTYYNHFRETGFLDLCKLKLPGTKATLEGLLPLADEIEELYLVAGEQLEDNPETLAILNRYPHLNTLHLTRLVDTRAWTKADGTIVLDREEDCEPRADTIRKTMGRIRFILGWEVSDPDGIKEAWEELGRLTPLQVSTPERRGWFLSTLAALTHTGVPWEMREVHFHGFPGEIHELEEVLPFLTNSVMHLSHKDLPKLASMEESFKYHLNSHTLNLKISRKKWKTNRLSESLSSLKSLPFGMVRVTIKGLHLNGGTVDWDLEHLEPWRDLINTASEISLHVGDLPYPLVQMMAASKSLASITVTSGSMELQTESWVLRMLGNQKKFTLKLHDWGPYFTARSLAPLRGMTGLTHLKLGQGTGGLKVEDFADLGPLPDLEKVSWIHYSGLVDAILEELTNEHGASKGKRELPEDVEEPPEKKQRC